MGHGSWDILIIIVTLVAREDEIGVSSDLTLKGKMTNGGLGRGKFEVMFKESSENCMSGLVDLLVLKQGDCSTASTLLACMSDRCVRWIRIKRK